MKNSVKKMMKKSAVAIFCLTVLLSLLSGIAASGQELWQEGSSEELWAKKYEAEGEMVRTGLMEGMIPLCPFMGNDLTVLLYTDAGVAHRDREKDPVAVDGLAFGGQGDDRDVGEFPDPLQGLDPIHPGHHPIQKQQLHPFLFEALQGFQAVGCLQHPVSYRFQIDPDRLSDIFFVITYQYRIHLTLQYQYT